EGACGQLAARDRHGVLGFLGIQLPVGFADSFFASGRHLASSACTKAVSSVGDIVARSKPSASSRSRTTGASSASPISRFAGAVISGGSPAGAAKPNQVVTARSG